MRISRYVQRDKIFDLLGWIWIRLIFFLWKYGFKIVKFHLLSIELRTCRVNVDRGTVHMQCWGQRIASRTGVEPSSGHKQRMIQDLSVLQCAYPIPACVRYCGQQARYTSAQYVNWSQ